MGTNLGKFHGGEECKDHPLKLRHMAWATRVKNSCPMFPPLKPHATWGCRLSSVRQPSDSAGPGRPAQLRGHDITRFIRGKPGQALLPPCPPVHLRGPDLQEEGAVEGGTGEHHSSASSPLPGCICVSSRETLVCSLERAQKLPN